MNASRTLLKTRELTKSFEEEFTLGPVSLTFEQGGTIAFLGKNGAGKSTLFNLLTGNLDATKGEVLIHNQKLTPDTPSIKRAIGYLPQKHVLPRWATAAEILVYASGLSQDADSKAGSAKRTRELEPLMKQWDCLSYKNQPLASLSHGMRKRVGLALATLNDPDILILDEPFSGLDLYQIKALEDEIQRRNREDKLTVLSTHIAPYTAKLCSQVYIVDAGQVSEMQPYQQLGFEQRIQAVESYFFGAQDE